MSLWTYIENLRQEPEEKRQLVRWWASVIVTLVILALWFLLQGLSITRPAESSVTTSSTSTSVSTLADIKLKIITGWQTLTKTK